MSVKDLDQQTAQHVGDTCLAKSCNFKLPVFLNRDATIEKLARLTEEANPMAQIW